MKHLIVDGTLLGQSIFFPALSCLSIRKLQPYSSSGYYWVTSSSGSVIRVYCDMSKACGNTTGGLTRIAVLNNSNRQHVCVGEWMTFDENTSMCTK